MINPHSSSVVIHYQQKFIHHHPLSTIIIHCQLIIGDFLKEVSLNSWMVDFMENPNRTNGWELGVPPSHLGLESAPEMASFRTTGSGTPWSRHTKAPQRPRERRGSYANCLEHMWHPAMLSHAVPRIRSHRLRSTEKCASCMVVCQLSANLRGFRGLFCAPWKRTLKATASCRSWGSRPPN